MFLDWFENLINFWLRIYSNLEQNKIKIKKLNDKNLWKVKKDKQKMRVELDDQNFNVKWQSS